jgi:hypothetical protein
MDQIVNDMNLAIHCGSLWLAVWQVNPIVYDMNLAIHLVHCGWLCGKRTQ